MTNTLDWALLFEEEAPRLMRFLRRFGPRISPEDVAQDAFAKLCASKTEGIISPRAYLFRTARNLALNEARRVRTAQDQLASEAEVLIRASPAPSPEDQVIAAEELRRLESVLALLPAKQRDAILLFRVEGLAYKEIGERLGVSPRTVERYVADAVAHCHLALRDEAGEE